ncbi:hypothetical protein ACSBR1_004427 [Camellia fascicularis]
MQQLLGKLAEHEYIEWHRCEQNTMAHPFSLDLFHAFPRVLIMDCTYKTNRHGLPLLEIFECTNNYVRALNILCGLMDENIFPKVIVIDREFALMNAIDVVFCSSKHLLCRWHINKNRLAKCKKMFENEYHEHLSTLHKEFSAYPKALDYVTQTWLKQYKEKFVASWTNSCMHYGNATTNRAESAHSSLKKQLESSQGSFETCWTKIYNLLELQHTAIKASL